MKKIALLSLLAITLIGCKKDASYTVTVYNPESFTIEVGSGDFIGGTVAGNTSNTYSGTEKNGQDYVVHILTSYDAYGNGDSFQYTTPVSFDVVDGGSYYHEIGSGVVTEQ